MAWGNQREPVAEETKLGWTLLGPTEAKESERLSSIINVLERRK